MRRAETASIRASLLAFGLAVALLLGAGPAWAITLGQIDTFDTDGDPLGWDAGINNPTPPSAAGGFLTITGGGGFGPGSNLLGFNRAQWAGDYIGAGVTEIQLFLENLGTTTLDIRLAFESAAGAPGQGQPWLATTQVVQLASGESDTFSFGITDAGLDGIGDFNTLMSNAGGMRILSAVNLSAQGDSIAGSLRVDNILAIPEPSAAPLVLAGLAMLALRRRC
jgi:hypothetical protein